MEFPVEIHPQVSTADSLYTEIPEAPPAPIEQLMLSHDRIYVVLGVVLVIWFGLLYFLFRTDRRLDRIEKEVEQCLAETTQTIHE